MALQAGRAVFSFERAYGAGQAGLNLDNIPIVNHSVPPQAEQQRIFARLDELITLVRGNWNGGSSWGQPRAALFKRYLK